MSCFTVVACLVVTDYALSYRSNDRSSDVRKRRLGYALSNASVWWKWDSGDSAGKQKGVLAGFDWRQFCALLPSPLLCALGVYAALKLYSYQIGHYRLD